MMSVVFEIIGVVSFTITLMKGILALDAPQRDRRKRA